MASKWASATVLKALFNLCFIILFFQVLAFAEWVFASSMSANSPVAHVMPYFAFLLGAQAISLLLYFRYPWVAVLVAWLTVGIILARVVPWGAPAWRSVLLDFRFEIVYVVLAHAGFVAFIMKNRAEAQEMEEVVGPARGSTENQP